MSISGVLSNIDTRTLNSVKQKGGGSVWESNPPKTLLTPPDGFEVREAHRDSNAPSFVS